MALLNAGFTTMNCFEKTNPQKCSASKNDNICAAMNNKRLLLSLLFHLLALGLSAQTSIWDAALTRYAAQKKQVDQINMFISVEKTKKNLSENPLLPDWEASDLPLFCKIEHHIAQKSRIPVLFRLGSVDYVNFLEQKPGYGH